MEEIGFGIVGCSHLRPPKAALCREVYRRVMLSLYI